MWLVRYKCNKCTDVYSSSLRSNNKLSLGRGVTKIPGHIDINTNL